MLCAWWIQLCLRALGCAAKTDGVVFGWTAASSLITAFGFVLSKSQQEGFLLLTYLGPNSTSGPYLKLKNNLTLLYTFFSYHRQSSIMTFSVNLDFLLLLFLILACLPLSSLPLFWHMWIGFSSPASVPMHLVLLGHVCMWKRDSSESFSVWLGVVKVEAPTVRGVVLWQELLLLLSTAVNTAARTYSEL